MIAPRDPFSDVVDERRKITPDWYSWFTEMNTAIGAGGGPGPTPSGHEGIVYLSDFLTATGDQTANINAAFASFAATSWSGTLVWDVIGKIPTTDTIHVGAHSGTLPTDPNYNDNSGPTAFINILGVAHADNCGISYRGPVDRAALAFHKNKFFYMRNLDVTNDSGFGFGSSIGISFGGQGHNPSLPGSFGSGTQTLAALIENVRLINWHVGIQMGNDYGEASEFILSECTFYGNDTAFFPVGFNCLDYTFFMVNMSDNNVGLHTGASDGFNVYGGSATNNTVCDIFVEGNGIVALYGYRTETSIGAPMVKGNFGRNVVLQNCQYNNSSAAGGSAVIMPDIGQITVRDCRFEGWIQASSSTNAITISNSVLWGNPNTRLPFFYNMDGAWGSMPHIDVYGNSDRTGTTSFDNYRGSLRETWVDGSPYRATGMQASLVTIFDREEPTNTIKGNIYGADWLALSRVRQLAEGPTPGWNVPLQFTLVTSAGTLAGGTVLQFASVPANVVPYMTVEDLTTGGLHFSARVVSKTATTVTLSGSPALSGNVGAGSTIRFVEQTGTVLTTGKNLRVAGVFPGSGTFDFLFKRAALTVQGFNPGGQNVGIVATTGQFFRADVGKLIKMPGLGNGGWTDWYGHISKYIDSTHVWIQPGRGLVPPVVPVVSTAEIGENEPDADYIVAGLCGNANETFWLDTSVAQTSAGFRLRSSNAASAAVITALIVR